MCRGQKKPATVTLRNARSPVKLLKHSKSSCRLKEAKPTPCELNHVARGSALSNPKPLALAPSSRARYNSLMPPVSQTIRVKVLFFGRLKELLGYSEDSLEFQDAATIEQLFALFAARLPELAKYRSSVVASRNQEFAAWDTSLHSGDEVAFLPPVSGG